MLLGQAFFLANITSIHVTAEMNIKHLATNKALLYCISLYKSNRMPETANPNELKFWVMIPPGIRKVLGSRFVEPLAEK